MLEPQAGNQHRVRFLTFFEYGDLVTVVMTSVVYCRIWQSSLQRQYIWNKVLAPLENRWIQVKHKQLKWILVKSDTGILDIFSQKVFKRHRTQHYSKSLNQSKKHLMYIKRYIFAMFDDLSAQNDFNVPSFSVTCLHSPSCTESLSCQSWHTFSFISLFI